MYSRMELFAAPPVMTEGARIPNPRRCRAMTPAGKEIVYLSNEESVASSDHELKSWDDVFAGVLRDLGIDHEEKRPKKATKKKVTVAGGAARKKAETAGAASDIASRKGTTRFRQSNLEDFVIVDDSFEELPDVGEKYQSSAAAAARSSGSAGSKGPESGATPSSIDAKETETEPEAEKLFRKTPSKRPRVEKTATTPPAKKAATGKPIGKKGSFRSHYSDVSPVICSRPKLNIIPLKATTVEGKSREIEKTLEKQTDAAKTGKAPEVMQGPEVVKVIGADQPVIECIELEAHVENPTAHHTDPVQTEMIKTSTAGRSAGGAHVEGVVKDIATGGGDVAGSGADAGKRAPGKKPKQPSPIHAEDTLGDIYYKTYDESHANEPNAPV
ncbi:hypothetical protein HanRHA438_Chr12g0567301 [Helianthus annuus]|uniref:Uncharacterized protein n=1 Tax=Helianthus annuus TaxID=4232 RepID=A0A9K3MXA3_HELAN|nr:hypothetical protein HanXRQr2_Chr12g0555941 [Helianthus annuus]KAJ0490455.1 hypothetical protein HanHA300_Chr12g0455651 [Helianthus annuus]KAJ0494668.1 hypothetical protein HanIR_Chr12g0600051 [Helianthus annuus]KAJ0506373.1 hypothetical protein HanHA89_Chr12g0481221 [Helianthus annuus]KAJ0676049.1 hypothetical protein HanLR1_Chr12g0458191 [Helianthus annuus]